MSLSLSLYIHTYHVCICLYVFVYVRFYSYLHTHTHTQGKLIPEFRDACESIFEEFSEQKFAEEAQINDQLVVRYLRARHHNLENAVAMFLNTMISI